MVVIPHLYNSPTKKINGVGKHGIFFYCYLIEFSLKWSKCMFFMMHGYHKFILNVTNYVSKNSPPSPWGADFSSNNAKTSKNPIFFCNKEPMLYLEKGTL